ncbi:MAG: radical SAM protein [Candidatus Aureabacteria bacterium]|nr:radical SAM protein [Candidatus Auribacterota bacterium]
MGYAENIRWVDEYVKNIAPYVFVREADSLLIKIPNEAYKLNSQGMMVVKHILSGKSVVDIVNSYGGREEEVARDIHFFFCDLKALMKGCYREKEEREAIEKVPFEIPYNTLPVLSEIALTYRCNLACSFCYASCGCKKDEDHEEMTTDQVKEVLRIIRYEAEVPSVSFTGGEPLLRVDLFDIVSFAKELGMWTNLITNGVLADKKKVKELKKVGLDSAQVSLESGIAGVHDMIVGRGGAFERTICGLRNFRDENIRVHTNTTVTGMNKSSLRSILDVVKREEMGKFSMNMLMPAGSAIDRQDELLVTYSEIGGIVMDIAERARSMELEFMWYSPTPVCIFNPIVNGLGNKACAACDGLLSVAPDGQVLPCSSYPRPMGSLLEKKTSFKELWKSEDFRFFQEKRYAHAKCRDCGHLAFCQGGCPLYWDQVGYQELMEEKNGILS